MIRCDKCVLQVNPAKFERLVYKMSVFHWTALSPKSWGRSLRWITVCGLYK